MQYAIKIVDSFYKVQYERIKQDVYLYMFVSNSLGVCFYQALA